MGLSRGVTRSTRAALSRAIGSDGGGGAAVLDIRAHVGTSTSPTSTGTKAVTGVGFEPKVVLPFSFYDAVAGARTNALLGIGAATASAAAVVSVSSSNAQATSATHRRHDNTKMLSAMFNNDVYADASLSSLDSDGFTGNWTKYLEDSAAYILNHVCLGGTDLEVSLTQHQMNATNAPQSFAHGLTGGAPTALMFFSTADTTAPAATSTNVYFNVGAWASSSVWSATLFSQTGLATSSTRRRFGTDSVVGWHDTVARRRMTVASVDATNVNATYPFTNQSSAVYFWMFAIRGAKAQVGTFDCNGSLDPLTISTPEITPKLFLPVFVPQGVDSVGTFLNDLGLSIGASDGTNNVSCGITDQNGGATTNARRFQSSTTLCEYNTAGTKVFEGAATFSGNSVILDPTTNSSSNFGQGGYLILGS